MNNDIKSERQGPKTVEEVAQELEALRAQQLVFQDELKEREVSLFAALKAARSRHWCIPEG